jgi:dCMP deaminase
MSNNFKITTAPKMGQVSIKVDRPQKETTPKKEVLKENLPSWIEYYINIAREVATRAQCYRNKVGALLVKDKQIISTGYNGAPSGRRSCYDYSFCYRDRTNIESGTRLEACLASGAHAETNTVTQAAKHGVATEGATLFLVGHKKVCETCKAILINAGVKKAYIEDPETGVVVIVDIRREWKKHKLETIYVDYKKCKGKK